MASRDERRAEAAARGELSARGALSAWAQVWRLTWVLGVDYFWRNGEVMSTSSLFMVSVYSATLLMRLLLPVSVGDGLDPTGLRIVLPLSVAYGALLLGPASLNHDIRKHQGRVLVSLPIGGVGIARMLWALAVLPGPLLLLLFHCLVMVVIWRYSGHAYQLPQFGAAMVLLTIGVNGLIATFAVRNAVEYRERLVRRRWDMLLTVFKVASCYLLVETVVTSGRPPLSFPNALALAVCPLYAALSYQQLVRWAQTPRAISSKPKPLAGRWFRPWVSTRAESIPVSTPPAGGAVGHQSWSPGRLMPDRPVSARSQVKRQLLVLASAYMMPVLAAAILCLCGLAWGGSGMGSASGPVLCMGYLFAGYLVLMYPWSPVFDFWQSLRVFRALPVSSTRLTLLVMTAIVGIPAGALAVYVALSLPFLDSPERHAEIASIVRICAVWLGTQSVLWRIYAVDPRQLDLAGFVLAGIFIAGTRAGWPPFNSTVSAICTGAMLAGAGFFLLRRGIERSRRFYGPRGEGYDKFAGAL